MNPVSFLICKLLLLPVTISYYSSISTWLHRLGKKSFLLLPVADVKWLLFRKRGPFRAFIAFIYAIAVASIRLGSITRACSLICARKRDGLESVLKTIVSETPDFSLCHQYVNIPEQWRYKPKGKAFADLNEITSALSPDFVPYYEEEEPRAFPLKSEEVGIVIPVYNGKNHLEVLLPSLFRNTNLPHRFIFVNDCSPDPEVLPWLKAQCEERDDCLILENEENLGFPATVNKGAAYCKGHFVILNTDTEVPSNWLERLMLPIWDNPKVASVTPFSDAATIFSFPSVGDDALNQRFRREFGMEHINQVLRQTAPDAPYLDAPTGVGFCMAINGDVWRKIGGLDAETFGKGYGEENDWCQRAIKAGYQNVLNPKLYVAHHHGGSFESEKKKQLIASAAAHIKKLHPNYFADVSCFVRQNPWRNIRAAAIIRLIMQVPCRHVLFLTFTWGGGSDHYLNAEIRKCLKEGDCAITLAYDSRKNVYKLTFFCKNYRIEFNNITRDIVFSPEFSMVDRVVINQLASWNSRKSFGDTADWISKLKSELACPMVFLAHDYFALCPGITMTTSTYSLCPVDEKSCDCSKCLSVNKKWRSPDLSLKKWHENWGRIFHCCDEIRCFSNSTAEYYRSIINVTSDKITVKPHAQQMYSTEKLLPCTESLRICVVGGITEIKGSIVISKLALKLKKSHPDAKIYIIGTWYGKDLQSNMCLVPAYDKCHLRDIMHHINATLCFFASVCPETFSYVISELKEINAPIVSFNIGAQGERLADYDNCELVDKLDADSAYDGILRLYEKLKKSDS